MVLDPITLIERLAALIPAPRKKLVSYHGVFAPAFPLRHTVVPPPPDAATSQPQVEPADQARACSHPAPATTTVPGATPLSIKLSCVGLIGARHSRRSGRSLLALSRELVVLDQGIEHRL